MIGRRWPQLVITIGLGGLVITILIPVAALALRVIADGRPPVDGFDISPRQAALMLRTVALALAATLGAITLSLPAAHCLGRMGWGNHAARTRAADFSPRGLKSAALPLLVMAPLMLPPKGDGVGWERLGWAGVAGGSDWPSLLRCAWTWMSWAWPIPALILGSGFARMGRAAYESALLSAGSSAAFRRAVLPALSRHLAISALLLFVLFLGEYSVPHACGLSVLATEVLAVHIYGPVDVVWLSLPLGGAVLAALLLARLLWHAPVPGMDRDTGLNSAGPSGAAGRLTFGLVIVTAAVPMIALAWRSSLLSDIAEAYATYHTEMLLTFAVCGGAGACAGIIGIAVAAVTSIRAMAIIATLVFGLLPGAAIGEAVLSAYRPQGWPYNTAPFDVWGWWIYNHWPIVVIGLAARFVWIGALAAWLALRSVPGQLVAQSTIDGSGALAARVSLALRQQWPTLLAGAFLAAALAAADVATAEMVQVPAIRMVSLILIEKFHRFESGMQVALSLCLVVSVFPGAILMYVALKRRG